MAASCEYAVLNDKRVAEDPAAVLGEERPICNAQDRLTSICRRQPDAHRLEAQGSRQHLNVQPHIPIKPSPFSNRHLDQENRGAWGAVAGLRLLESAGLSVRAQNSALALEHHPCPSLPFFHRPVVQSRPQSRSVIKS